MKMRLLMKHLLSKRYLYHHRCLSQLNRERDKENHDRNNIYRPRNIIAGVCVASLVAYEIYEKKYKNVLGQAAVVEVGGFRDGLPSYSLEDLSKHCTQENRVWVSYKEGVYDITDFISKHPGGDQIMLAAGSSLEPFWILYGVHEKPQILSMLETMRIGNLYKDEVKYATKGLSDPYSSDPIRHNVLKAASRKPFNAEPPPSLLINSFNTPNELFYVRNHLPVPEVDPKTYELEIEVEGKGVVKTLTLDDIKKLSKHTVNATIMCAGTRRSEMNKVKSVKGLEWGIASTGNASWTGARLRDVLQLVGITEGMEEFKHVQFEGLDVDPTNTPYGASIPYVKAVDKRGDVILAYEMNNQPLSRDHGFPVRIVAPGIVGARNVKWLGKIIISTRESESHWQQNDYKGFSPSTDWDTVDWNKSPAIQELPVISAICRPLDGETVKVENGKIIVKGYAWSGGGKKIIRVDVTVDGGNTWHVGDFDYQDSSAPPRHWSWTLWTAQIPVKTGTSRVEIWAKAVDSSYNTQPESFKNIWNLRGVLNNAYHRINVNLKW